MSEKVLLNNKNEIFRPTILRLGTVFGPSLRNRFDLVVNTMAKNAYYNKKINIHGGTQWRPNIHVEDVADGIISIIKSKKNRVGDQIFNLSSDISNLQIKELGVMAKKVFTDEAYKKAVVKSKAPLEFISEGYEKECKAYVENITKVGEEYRSLLSG